MTASFKNPDTGRVDTESSNATLSGKSGTDIIISYNGNSVLSAYTPARIEGLTWALLAEIDEAEALAAVKFLRELTAVIAIIGILAIVVFTLWITRRAIASNYFIYQQVKGCLYSTCS